MTIDNANITDKIIKYQPFNRGAVNAAGSAESQRKYGDCAKVGSGF